MLSCLCLAQPATPPKPATTPGLAIAIEEFRVQTANLSGSSGVKSAGNRPAAKPSWHGRIYENLRNNAFDANPHQIVQRGGAPRQLRRNQYGFSVTGPVVLPKVYNGAGKTFFTMTYEGVKESVGQFSLNTIPTSLERTGQYGHVVDPNGAPLLIYDPLSTAANPAYNSSQDISTTNLQYLRQQFPGNVIPLTRLDPVAQSVVSFIPQPNTNAGPFFQNNYYAVTQQLNKANGFIVSVDHSFRKKHRLTLRLSKSDGLNGNAANFPTLANSNNPNVSVLSRGARIEHVFTASPTSVNTFRFNVDTQPNKNVAQLDARGKPFPRYQFNGVYQNLGQNNPIARDARNTFNLTNIFSSRWKAHRFIAEFYGNLNQVNTFRSLSPEGRFDFTAGYTSLPGIINTGHPFASFLLGAASTAQQTIVISPNYYRWHTENVHLADTWQLTPSLTLNFGVWISHYAQRTEKYNRQSNISFDEINPENGRPGALVAANAQGYGRSFLSDWISTEPNIGLAWSVLGDNNTVLRLNFSRFYNSPFTSNGHFGTQAFNGTETYLSPNTQLTPALLLADGLRPSRFPDLRPEAANGTTAQLWDTSGRQPVGVSYNINLQRQLAKNLIVSGFYNRNYGRDQYVGSNLANPNAISLENLKYRDKLNTLSFANSLRPFPQYQDFDVGGMYAVGKYRNTNAGFQIEKRTSGGLALTGSYNYFARMDDGSSPVQNLYDRKSGWARSAFANPHSVTVTFLYEFPFGPGKPLLSAGFIGKNVLGGWAFSGTSNYYSGSPLRLQPAFNNTGGVIPFGALYVDNVPGVDPRVDHPTPSRWFNPDAFVNPADFTPGSAPRVHPFLLGPGGYNHDMTLNKRMPIGGERTMEFTATLLNATNHANWNQPDMRIGTLATPNFNAGRIIGSNGGRIVQLGVRVNF
ncbi:MAG: hypothetical protein ABIR70_11575 [Bryobacteraceae bacterium]